MQGMSLRRHAFGGGFQKEEGFPFDLPNELENQEVDFFETEFTGTDSPVEIVSTKSLIEMKHSGHEQLPPYITAWTVLTPLADRMRDAKIAAVVLNTQYED